MKRFIAILVLACVPAVVWAGRVAIEGVRVWPAPDNTRVVFDVSAPVEYKVERLFNPDRLVLDFSNVSLTKAVEQPVATDAIMKSIRHARRNSSDLRIVLDLKQKSEYKAFLLKPNDEYGHRLVFDLYSPEQQAQQAQLDKLVQQAQTRQETSATPKPPVAQADRPAVKAVAPEAKPRDIVIAIDAGHGGEDPGARGYSGAYEKDLVLAIARRLKTMVEREPGMKPVMTRDGDYYLSLRKRTLKARDSRADLFVSIHADAFRDRSVRGSSLYVLSQNGATNEAARWLAEKENASDLIGGVSLDDKDNLLASVLLDLSQTATIQASFEAGDAVLRYMQPVSTLHKRQVQQAGFVVLKSPDIPSVLVETAFISNPQDEKRLRSADYQEQMASAIFKGIKDYFSKHPPVGTQIAAANRQHKISPGDTLSALAAQYRVSVERLRAANRLKNDQVRVGQVLTIPGDSEG
ncbi:MAG: N-acetylmuramoyl-L-alanine amidase [Gammaproteobacteria bacterium]|nr:N-acetylmuramoyl-L-alanine amidase [Gammaproteobacteria bacterium]